jgi:signal transduction histidine kinase
MFKSATLKLTAWYLLILVIICLLFSSIIYTIAAGELSTRINYLEQSPRFRYVPSASASGFDDFRDTQVEASERNLVWSLVVTNIAIWTIGGVGGYYLARRTLRPIEQAHEAQSRFTSDASHELRTPLAVMKTELEVALKDTTIGKEEMHDLMESNLEEVDKLTRLSYLLLELSRPNHDAIKKQSVSLDDRVKSVVKQFDKTGKRIEVKPHVEPLYVSANPESIDELMTILVDNALKYSPSDSVVTISLSEDHDRAKFVVANEGKGITKEDLPRIFDRFYRADSSRTGGTQSGYGLGLSLAKRIVELHSGELSASSAPGQTTTFGVSLPLFHASKAKIQ